LLHRVDRARRERKVSRSEYFRQAASNLLGLTGEQEVECYVRGYSTHPETPSEVEAGASRVCQSLAPEPWE
jgi:metal-responsive CopG/Arc/MetJ family transcriptional regulator